MSSHDIHNVSEGDTFYAISERWQVPISALSEANPSIDAKALQVGISCETPGVFRGPLVKLLGNKRIMLMSSPLLSCCILGFLFANERAFMAENSANFHIHFLSKQT